MKQLIRARKGLPIVPDMWRNRGRYRITKAQLKREEKLRRWLVAEAEYKRRG